MAGSDDDLQEKFLLGFANKRGNDLVAQIAKYLAELETTNKRLEKEIKSLKAYTSSLERMELMEEFLYEDDSYFPSEVVFSADNSALNCSGLYQLEYASDGSSFRWTGPERVTVFELSLKRRAPASIAIHVMRMISPDQQGPPQIFVDGSPVPTKLANAPDGSFVISAVAPARTKDFTLPTEIGLGLRKTISLEKDKRQLGAAFVQLEVEPALALEEADEKDAAAPLPAARSAVPASSA